MTTPNRFTPGSKAQALIARDEAVLSPSYTRSYPFVIARGSGTSVWDVDGQHFIDFTTGIAVTATGHAHPTVVKAIQEQAAQFIHMSGTDFYYAPQIELAERLASVAPFDDDAMIFFCNSGAEAVEAAVKLARYHTGRPRFIAFLRAFHGRTLGALSFTASKYIQRQGFFPMVPGVTHVPYPDSYHPLLHMDGFADQGEAVLDYIENVIFKTVVPAEEVAGILIEPIQGEGGYVVRQDSASYVTVTASCSLLTKSRPAWVVLASGGRLSIGASNPTLSVRRKVSPAVCRWEPSSPAKRSWPTGSLVRTQAPSAATRLVVRRALPRSICSRTA